MKILEERQVPKAHKLVINNRKTSMVTGVLDVLAFDLNEILLETEQGMLMIKGNDLHVNRLTLDKGGKITENIAGGQGGGQPAGAGEMRQWSGEGGQEPEMGLFAFHNGSFRL